MTYGAADPPESADTISQAVALECPECGYQHHEQVGQRVRIRTLECAGCGQVFIIDGHPLGQAIEAAQASLNAVWRGRVPFAPPDVSAYERGARRVTLWSGCRRG